MSNITDGHIQGLFLLKGNPIGPLDLIKEITDLLGQGDHSFLRPERSAVPHYRFEASFESAPANPLKQKASEHSPNPRKGQGRQELEPIPHYLFSFQANTQAPDRFNIVLIWIKLGNFLSKIAQLGIEGIVSRQIELLPRPPHTILPLVKIFFGCASKVSKI